MTNSEPVNDTSREKKRKSLPARRLNAEELGFVNEHPGMGLDGLLGVVYTEIGPDRVVSSLEVTPKLYQPMGLVHGGVYCAMIEATASFGGASWLSDRGHCVGVHNSTDFYRAVRKGTLTATATPLHRGRTQQLWRVAITDERGRDIAGGQVRLANVVDSDDLGNS